MKPVWDLMVLLGAWALWRWWERASIGVVEIGGEEADRIKLLVSWTVPWVGRRTVLGAQLEGSLEPVFWGWVLQEAAMEAANPKSAVVVGVGAGTAAARLRARGCETRAIEKSRRVAELARTEFGLQGAIEIGDGVEALATLDRAVDFVSVDCFDGSGASFGALSPKPLARLAVKTNVLAVNLVIDRASEARIAAAVLRRLRAYFAHVVAFRDNDLREPGDVPSNIVFVASGEPLDFDAIAERAPDGSDRGTIDWVRRNFVTWRVEPPLQKEETLLEALDFAPSRYEKLLAVELSRASATYLPAPDPAWPFEVACLAWLYFLWMRLSDRRKYSTQDFGPQWVARCVRTGAAIAMRLAGVTWSIEGLHENMAKLDGAGAIGCVSPHGAYPINSMFYGIPYFRCEFPQAKLRVGAASVLFYLPFVREYLLLFGARDINKRTLDKLVKAGCCVAVNPGGVREMVHQRSDKELVLVQRNLGLFKCALRHKTPVVVMYAFGENQMFTTHTHFMSLRLYLVDKFRIGLPWISGRFGLSFGALPVLPKPGRCVHVCGPLVPTTDIKGDVSDPDDLHRMAQLLYHRYKASLTTLFDKHKARLLPAHVAQRGIDVIWLGQDDHRLMQIHRDLSSSSSSSSARSSQKNGAAAGGGGGAAATKKTTTTKKKNKTSSSSNNNSSSGKRRK